jgi:methyl-accepting chemotaxis protein
VGKHERMSGSSAVKMGLRARALFLLAGAVVLVATVSALLIGPLVARSFDDQVARRGVVTVGILEQHQALRLALSLRNAEEARRVAADLLSGDGDLTYVILLDGNDKVLGSAVRDEEPGAAEAAAKRHLHDLANVAGDEAQAHTNAVYRFSRVVKREQLAQDDDLAMFAGGAVGEEKPLGTILLGLSAAAARENLRLVTMVTIALIGGVLTLTFLVFFSRIAGRLRRMSAFAAKVAGGDLSSRLEDLGNDEIGQLADSLQEMTRRTGAMVGRLQQAAQSVARVSTELLGSSSQQGEAATRQAASVAETGATVAELRETFTQASDRAQAVIDLAQRSEESTTSGRASVDESVQAMEQIRDQVGAMSGTITSLVERTAQISSIIDTVNDLAEQSNVLALNAAIEAAKAGEHGRGFAVVAREVRSLAERSKDSTAQVRLILKDIEKATGEAMRAIEEGSRRSNSGMALAHRAGEAIGLLDRAINDSSTAARQIAASTRQQAVGVDQIWQAMRDIDRAVNESASGIKQIELVSRNLKELSEQMAELVSRYRVTRDAA